MSAKSYIPIPGSTERSHSTVVIQVMASVMRWSGHVWALRRQRKALASLDSRLLSDVGLTRDDVRHELNKPFWR